MAGHDGHADLKQRAIEKLKEFWITSLYLFIFLGAFTVCRRMVLAEFGVTYLHYGVALIEALVIAKVVLIGRAVGLACTASATCAQRFWLQQRLDVS